MNSVRLTSKPILRLTSSYAVTNSTGHPSENQRKPAKTSSSTPRADSRLYMTIHKMTKKS